MQDYDHAIVLVDTTKLRIEPDKTADNGAGSASGSPLGRRWTKGTLREEMARRKYSKWQEEKAKDAETAAELSDDARKDNSEKSSAGDAKKSTPTSERTGRRRDKLPFRSKKKPTKTKETEDSFVDILYENQRGAFLCGIPLYSGNSLLNFDPSPWQTSTFHDSPVNITNAQLPDPSWGWAWRTWYVDMSYDVDEEGWQYSFNFSSGFAWHGTHPWFHSFVRRRRWLRKRVKIHLHKANGDLITLEDAHLLTADYFTIHASRDRSRDSSAERTTNNRSSFLSIANSESDGELDTSDISDILKLMTALKKSRLDREKLSAVKAFLDQDSDDLVYLADNTMEIMRYFIYQTSQRQLQSSLQYAFDKAKPQQETSKVDASQEKEEEALTGKASNLLKAVLAVNEFMDGEWSNSKGETNLDALENTDTSQGLGRGKETFELTGKDSGDDQYGEEIGTVADEIKGIQSGTEISDEPDTQRDKENQPSPPKTLNKGKGRA